MTPKVLIVLLAALLLAPPRSVNAQEQPLVLFITGTRIETVTFAQSGPPGVRKLADIFDALGARVRLLEENQPIPPETRVVVITRPLERIDFLLATRLWLYLQDGGNMLVALDPPNYFLGSNNINRGVGRSGLFDLFISDYGLWLRESLLVNSWSNQETILDLGSVYQQAQPEVLANPITQPHQQYGLPIRFWGARHITTDPFGLYSFAVPLFYTEETYAENDPNIYPTVRGRRVEPPESEMGFDMPRDELGRLHIAAYAQNTRHRSRVVVLGDSEALMNGFGLAGTLANPVYPGNTIFAQRIAAWLMEFPVSAWPSLPTNFTWLAADSDSDDWEAIARRFSISDLTRTGEVERVRGFYDDRYAYLSLNTAAGQPITSLTLTTPDGTIEAAPGTLTYINEAGTGIPIPDGAATFGEFVEIRLPLRFFERNQEQFNDICTPTECVGGLFRLTPIGLRAPHDFALSTGPIGEISSPETDVVNVRSAPDADSAIVGIVPIETEIAVLGRTEDGEWYRVRNALADGWMARFLVEVNGDPALLPVIDVES